MQAKSQEPSVTPAPTTNQSETDRGWGFRRVVLVATGALMAPIVIIFVLGLLLAFFGDAEPTALRIQIIRDILVIALVLEGLLIILALVVLIIQIARLVNLVRDGVRPILDNTQQTVGSAKDTVQFVGQNIRDPIVQMRHYFGGMRAFLQDSLAIWRIFRPSKTEESAENRISDHAP